MASYWVYILASKRNGTLYTGVTGSLLERVSQHRNKQIPGFTKQYGVTRLVYCEEYDDIGMAIYREKCIKHWRRSWKLKLIERHNPQWKDLYFDIS